MFASYFKKNLLNTHVLYQLYLHHKFIDHYKPSEICSILICSGLHSLSKWFYYFNIYVALVSGNFTPWTDWSACTTSCGFGTRSRYRNCTNPPPLFGGSDCIGSLYQMKECENASDCPGKKNDFLLRGQNTPLCRLQLMLRKRSQTLGSSVLLF